MAKLTVKDVDLKGKKVLVRVDFNVPVKDGVITNDNRITAALPTIKYILEQGGRAILFSHLGRVKEEADKEGKSLAPVAADLAAKLGQDVKFIPGVTRGAELEAAVNALEDGQVLLVENTRFEDVDGKKESKNDPELGKYWASLGDGIFVNDAFGTAHRAHASNVGISANVDKAVAGFLLENEIAYIKEAVETPERPFVAILGGSKVSDKIGVIENLLAKADKVLIGGGMTYTFYKAQGIEIGNSLVEEDKLDVAKALLEKSNGKLILPVDSKEANAFADRQKSTEACTLISSLTECCCCSPIPCSSWWKRRLALPPMSPWSNCPTSTTACCAACPRQFPAPSSIPCRLPTLRRKRPTVSEPKASWYVPERCIMTSARWRIRCSSPRTSRVESIRTRIWAMSKVPKSSSAM